VFQAALARGAWHGFADFLIRVEVLRGNQDENSATIRMRIACVGSWAG
jgi:hypothetical protein